MAAPREGKNLFKFKPKVKRRGKPNPLNHQKKLGPKEK